MTSSSYLEKARVLHAALQRDTFTVQQLARILGVDESKVQETVARSKDLLEELGQSTSDTPSDHPTLFRLRKTARRNLAMQSVELGRRLHEPQQSYSSGATHRASVAVRAVEASLASEKRTDAACQKIWRERVKSQLDLARQLVRLVQGETDYSQFQARLKHLSAKFEQGGESTAVDVAKQPAHDADTRSGAATAAAHGPSRQILRYDNRRLYDTVESRYITLADIRRLIIDRIPFVVMDRKKDEDITRAIMLQVIAEQEHGGEPLMSRDFLSQVIRVYGSVWQRVIGRYLEESLKLFAGQQRDARERIRSVGDPESTEAANHLAQRNYQRWRAVQDEIYRTLTDAAHNRSEGERRENEVKSKES